MLEDSRAHGDRPDLKELGYAREIYSDHVLQDVSSNRITVALIDTGLHSQQLTTAEKIRELEKYFRVPPGGVSGQLFENGEAAVSLFLASRKTYGR
jgi:hypothetical protein